MEVYIHADNQIESTAAFKEYFKDQLVQNVTRFDAYVTKYEVYFSDASNKKDTPNNITCVIEARVKGRNPESVSHTGNKPHEAFKGALEKLKTVLDKIVAMQRNH